MILILRVYGSTGLRVYGTTGLRDYGSTGLRGSTTLRFFEIHNIETFQNCEKFFKILKKTLFQRGKHYVFIILGRKRDFEKFLYYEPHKDGSFGARMVVLESATGLRRVYDGSATGLRRTSMDYDGLRQSTTD